MSIPTTSKEVGKIKRLLQKPGPIFCLDGQTYVKFLLVAQQVVLAGRDVKADIVRAWEKPVGIVKGSHHESA